MSFLEDNMKKFLVLIIQFSFWFLAFVFAGTDQDNPAWLLMNLSILIGIVGPPIIWSKTKHFIIGLGLAFLKASICFYFMLGWWKITIPEIITDKTSRFFWWLPLFLMMTVFFEILIINQYSRDIEKTDSSSNE